MMIDDKIVEIEVYPQNRKQYEHSLKRELKNRENIKIKQKDILKTSRALVFCICDYCGNELTKRRVDVSNKTFCDSDCRDRHLSEFYSEYNKPVNKIEVECTQCEKNMYHYPSKVRKQENFFCTRECYAIHREINHNNTERYNYQNLFDNCLSCNKKVKTTAWARNNNKNKFCSQECYWKYRKENYHEQYFNHDLRDRTVETKIEGMVRTWLEENDTPFVQEAGFLRKYFVDFYLPDYKAIIEVNGDYWHVNPKVYDIENNNPSKKKVTSQQEEILASDRDSIKINDLESYGYEVFATWETDIHTDLNKEMERIMFKIKTKNKNP